MTEVRSAEDARVIDGVVAGVMEEGEWFAINLPWVEEFWEEVTPETFLRLNPHWEIDAEKEEEVTEVSFPVKDILFEKDFSVQITKKTSLGSASVDNGWQKEVAFSVEPLWITFAFRPLDGEKNTAVSYQITGPCSELERTEIEQTVQFWLQSAREYYRLYENDSLKLRFWRMLMNKVMLPQTPIQRRICAFMLKFAMLELVVIAGCGVGIWLYFTQ
ncbi:MAG: hypothetical protein ACNI27_10000 [Desulfovibrio sp.]